MITEKDLLEAGFIKNQDPVEKVMFPFKKVLSSEAEEGELALVISRLRGQADVALVTPFADLVYLNGAKSLEEIKVVESVISGWEPNY